MKAILLLTGAYLNGGSFVSAGETANVGAEPLEISDDRAADMVVAGYAKEVGEDGELIEADATDKPVKAPKAAPAE
jgi:hypothetical protein